MPTSPTWEDTLEDAPSWQDTESEPAKEIPLTPESWKRHEAASYLPLPQLPEPGQSDLPTEGELKPQKPILFPEGGALPVDIPEAFKRARSSPLARSILGPPSGEMALRREANLPTEPSTEEIMKAVVPLAMMGGVIRGVPAAVLGAKYMFDQVLALPDQYDELKNAVTAGDPVRSRKAAMDLGLNAAMVAAVPLAAKFGAEHPRETPQPTEVANASSQPSATRVPESEVRPPMGEEAPLRQQGEVTDPQATAEAAQGAEGGLPLTEAKAPEAIAAELGIQFKPGVAGTWNFDWTDPNAKPGTPKEASFITKAGASPEQVRAKFEAIRAPFLEEAKAPEIIPPSKPTIEPLKGDRIVEVVRPDGSFYYAAFGDKYYDMTQYGGGTHASIGKEVEGHWSHGATNPGEVIREINTASAPNAPEAPRAAAGDQLPAAVAVETPTTKSEPVSSKLVVPEAKPVAAKPAETPVAAVTAESGMGAARLGEVAVEGNPDVYGIAQRVREQRAAAGQVNEVPRGEGISAPDSVERGREILTQDATAADTALTTFEADPKKAVSADGMAVVRAKGEELARAARRIEEKFGTDSPEYNKAWTALSEWDARTKPMQTEWHKIGEAQQGETDIDTGTFTGLQRAHKDATGKDFTPRQAKVAKAKATQVKAAADATDAATQKLNDQLASDAAGINAAERRAVEAANKTVREAAVRLADAETKSRVAATVAERNAARIQETAARKALEAAQKVQREAAARLAESENEARIREASRKALDDQDKAAQRALDAANKTVREAAARLAEAENKARVAKAGLEKKQAEQERRAAQQKLDAANKDVRNAAVAAAKAEVKNRVNPEIKVWEKVKEYLDKGETRFDDIRTKVATDLGLTVKQVTDLITQKPRAKYLADDVWRKQQALRRFQQSAKRWLNDSEFPLYRKAIESVPKILFSLKVGFHGTVALGTHAPMVAFQPRFWNTYVRDFGKMYKMIGKPAYYERQVQDLLRRPNYTTARRAGLVNDPFQYEDFNSPAMTQSFGALTGMGNRGYSVLKILRQDMFDQMWAKLPKTARIPEVASAIADGLNHATGVVKVSAPRGTAVALFAPRLEMSRVAWLAVDPIKAANTFASWKTASQGEKQFAINQVKEKAWVAGTMMALLAINQGVLTATDSKQEVNFTDPFHSDWLKFKAAGMTGSYGNAMITMARLPIRLYKIRSSDGGKLKNLVFPDEDSYTVLGEYGRSQLSPFASLATTLWLKGDWQNRPLPSSDRPVPKRLRAQGVKPYTWPEFWSEQFLPIPAEEAAREVWKHGLGMSDEQVKSMRKAFATIAVMGATGARLTDDVPYKKPSDSSTIK